MKPLIRLLIVALLAASCSGAGEPVAPTTETSAAPTTTTTTGVAPTPGTSTTTTTTTIEASPLTDQLIDPERLALMVPEDLPDPWATFIAQTTRPEDNDTAIQLTVQGVQDEAEDVVTYGRNDGYRVVHRPRFGGAVDLAVNTWVVLFATDDGAAGYLDDFVADTAKGVDAGRTGTFTVVDAAPFASDVIGDQTIGMSLVEDSSVGERQYETVVGFRVGRLLGFVSLTRADDSDARIPIQGLSEYLHARLMGVLEGRITVPVVPEPVILAAYAFEYEQLLVERYDTIVYDDLPEVIDDGSGGETDDSTTTTSSTTSSTSSTSSTSTSSTSSTSSTTTSSTTSTSTTTTTRIVRVEATAKVDAEGIVVGDDRVECDLVISLANALQRKHYVTVGDEAWLQNPTGSDYLATTVDDEPAASDLIYCPGWSPLLERSGLEGIVVPGTGTPQEFNGIEAERFELDVDDLAAVGLGPEAGAGIDLDDFNVWLAVEEPWVIGVEIRFGGSAATLEAVLGAGFIFDAEVEIAVDFRATRLNDAELAVEAPAGVDQRLERVGEYEEGL